MARHRTSFGNVRKLPSGRWQARYTGPDLVRHSAPVTFQTKGDAEAWLALQRVQIARGDWTGVPIPRSTTFAEFAQRWLHDRNLKPRTREEYQRILDVTLLPAFGSMTLKAITAPSVRAWHAGMGPDRPTQRARAYGLLKAILATAVTDDLIVANPCRIRGGGQAKRAKVVRPATLSELDAIVTAMPERYRPMVLLAAWCALRFGELVELRRKDIDLEHGVVKVRRGAVWVEGHVVVDRPKSEAGVRNVTIPPHLLEMLAAHLEQQVARGKEALLFPGRSGQTMAPASLYRVFYPAREKAGRPDLRFHDLRHTGATLAAQTGATLAELMHRLGHSTPQAALVYQHQALGRDLVLAQRLSDIARG